MVPFGLNGCLLILVRSPDLMDSRLITKEMCMRQSGMRRLPLSTCMIRMDACWGPSPRRKFQATSHLHRSPTAISSTSLQGEVSTAFASVVTVLNLLLSDEDVRIV